MSISPHQRINKHRPCPICRSAKCWGYFHNDGEFVTCTVESAGSIKTNRQGHFIHRINAKSFAYKPIQAKPKCEKPQNERAPAEHLNRIYSAMLELLTLEEKHCSDLLRRGLSHQAIKANNYKSTPSLFNSSQIADELSKRFDLRGVPGFFQDRGTWRMVNVWEGFLVPYRNTQGQIHGLQYRLDQPIDGKQKYLWFSSARFYKGTSSGSPVHFSKPDSVNGEALITEGALKADIISFFTNQPVIAAAGVSNFGKDFAVYLRKRFPKLQRAILCFDDDKYEPDEKKSQVRGALFSLGQQLGQTFFDVFVRDWSEEFKGYDDFLLAQTKNAKGETE